MPQTLSEQILSTKAGKPVKAGDIVIVDADLVFVADSSGPLALREMDDMGLTQILRPQHAAIFLDHSVPSPRAELSQELQFLYQAAEKHGVPLYQVGSGICHQLVLEEWAAPGMVVIGADSHSCTAGALCSFGTGMGASDVAVALGTGEAWLRVPEAIQVRLQGAIPKGVHAKDIVLEMQRRIGVSGATYKALEFTGEVVPTLGVSERATFSNMAVEMGGKVGLFPSDEQTLAWLTEHGRAADWKPLQPDQEASYQGILEIDCLALEPLVACPHQPDNVKPAWAVQGTRISQVFIGTCTNGRLDDLAIAARILKGRKVHPGTRLTVVPASRRVLLEAIELGFITDLIQAGAAVGIPSCASCFGMHMGVPGDGENVLSTQNRNFKGRMGNTSSSVFLASPATAAATALTGTITDPREI